MQRRWSEERQGGHGSNLQHGSLGSGILHVMELLSSVFFRVCGRLRSRAAVTIIVQIDIVRRLTD